MALVEGRQCGECVACCIFIPINCDQLEKPSNTMCPHCDVGAGCSVYQLRPDPCSGWNCGWRYFENLSIDWRPDVSGIVIRPDGLSENEITFVILDVSKKYQSIDFVNFVTSCVLSGFVVKFSRMGPAGCLPALVEINKHVVKEMENRELEAVRGKFLEIINHMDTMHVWERDGLKSRSFLVEN